MKNIQTIMITLFFATFMSCGQGGEGNTTKTFKVWGNCDMCKETIETSLKVDGISSADWNTETKMMEVSFDSTKISLDQIQQKIAAVGYDTEKYKGDDKAYDGLHKCCKYERKK